MKKEYNPVQKAFHYNQGTIETIDYILDAVEQPKSYLQGNAIKYIARYEYKGGIQDIEKAIYHLIKLKDILNNEKEMDDVNGH